MSEASDKPLRPYLELSRDRSNAACILADVGINNISTSAALRPSLTVKIYSQQFKLDSRGLDGAGLESSGAYGLPCLTPANPTFFKAGMYFSIEAQSHLAVVRFRQVSPLVGADPDAKALVVSTILTAEGIERVDATITICNRDIGLGSSKHGEQPTRFFAEPPE